MSKQLCVFQPLDSPPGADAHLFFFTIAAATFAAFATASRSTFAALSAVVLSWMYFWMSMKVRKCSCYCK